MKFTLHFHLDNAAFHDEDDELYTPEVVQCLANVARNVELGDRAGGVVETNGNRVGSWEITDD